MWGRGCVFCPRRVLSDLPEPFFGLCASQGEKGKRGIDGVDGMKVTPPGGRAGTRGWRERQMVFPAKPQAPGDPKPRGQVQTIVLVGLSWEGLDGPERTSWPLNLPSSFQGETGYPGLPGCKGSPGFDVSCILSLTF